MGEGSNHSWAALVAIVALTVSVAGAQASSGGVGPGGGGGNGGGGGGCSRTEFGKRTLEQGDCGTDVTTLNWILKAKSYGVPLHKNFKSPTTTSVRDFQRRKDVRASGVVNKRTRNELVGSMRRQMASWYGPGFYGNTTACGQTLRTDTVGVAHRSLSCGTKVVIGYRARYLRTRVIDRGPFVKRRYERDWDLTHGAAQRLGFEGTDKVRAAPIK
ncbi:MAG: septal ring lytic transglycosylase RlpA family protein [bacterium]